MSLLHIRIGTHPDHGLAMHLVDCPQARRLKDAVDIPPQATATIATLSRWCHDQGYIDRKPLLSLMAHCKAIVNYYQES